MPNDTSRLRDISVNLRGTAIAGNVAIGAAVPTGKRRFIYWVRMSHDSPQPQRFNFFRDGAVGAVALDSMYLSGSGAGALSAAGDTNYEMKVQIDSPFYILESGQRLGVSSPAGVNVYVVVVCYDEP